MRFDWYACTVPARADEVLRHLVASADLADCRPARAMHGYDRGAEVVRGDRVLCRALYGGPNGPDTHVWASGEDTEWFVGQVRGRWPAHRVTRVDSAEDFSAAGAWDTLSRLALITADEFDVQVTHEGDFHRGQRGRTLYLGSRKSTSQLVVYEKGKQLGVDPNWVRMEARVKPKGDARERLATALPIEVWGCASYLRTVAARICRQDLEAIKIGTIYRAADDARAWAAVTRQYGRLFERKAAELGGWGELGSFLEMAVTDSRKPRVRH
jgi:hypothetical protein